MLYVDADNTAAVRLYEQLGFHLHSTNAAFLTDVAPAPGHDAAQRGGLLPEPDGVVG
jgi:ribosomal protein S18 acetylase RimI-like enzyme